MNKEILEQFGITKETILDEIREVALSEFREDLQGEISRLITNGAKDQIKKAIEDIVSTQSAAALDVEFTPIDQWGDAKGPKTTVRDLFFKTCKEWWAQKVDASGKPSSYGSGQTMAEYHAKKLVDEIITGKMNLALAATIAEAKEVLIESLTGSLAQHIKSRIK